MRDRILLGMLTPSSNTVVEPITTSILAQLPEVSAHFSRFRVTEISLDPQALQQFDVAPMLQAAALLADARVGAIAWNGTSAGWLGFDTDIHLCEQITAATGVPSTTSVLALLELCQSCNFQKVGLVTPYVKPVQARIVENFARVGIDCICEQHLNLSVNFQFSEVGEETITTLVQAVASSKPDAIITFCTNLRAAPLASVVEAQLGIPFLDSTAAAVWKALVLAGGKPQLIQGWGQMFATAPMASLPQVAVTSG